MSKPSSRTKPLFGAERRALGRSLRARREELGLTQEAVGLDADVDVTYVGRIERGLINPTYSTLLRLTSALDVPLWRIVQDASGDA